MTDHKSLLICRTTCLFWYVTLHVPFDMTDYMSLLIWQTACPFWYVGLHVPFDMSDYMSLLIWHTTCPFWYDRLQVHFDMTDYMTLLIWQTTSLFVMADSIIRKHKKDSQSCLSMKCQHLLDTNTKGSLNKELIKSSHMLNQSRTWEWLVLFPDHASPTIIKGLSFLTSMGWGRG